MIHFLSWSSNFGGFLVSGALNFLNFGGEYGRGERDEALVAATGPWFRRLGFLCVFMSSVTFFKPVEKYKK